MATESFGLKSFGTTTDNDYRRPTTNYDDELRRQITTTNNDDDSSEGWSGFVEESTIVYFVKWSILGLMEKYSRG